CLSSCLRQWPWAASASTRPRRMPTGPPATATASARRSTYLKQALAASLDHQRAQPSAGEGARVDVDAVGQHLHLVRRRVTVDDLLRMHAQVVYEPLPDPGQVVRILPVERHAGADVGMTLEEVAGFERVGQGG